MSGDNRDFDPWPCVSLCTGTHFRHLLCLGSRGMALGRRPGAQRGALGAEEVPPGVSGGPRAAGAPDRVHPGSPKCHGPKAR